MTWKPKAKVLAFGVVLLTMGACRTLKPTPPVEAVLPYTSITNTSYISLSIETSIDEIETYLNSQFNGLVYEDMDLKNNGGDNLMVKAWKQSRIELALEGNELKYEIPLKLWIKYYYENKSLGISFTQPIEVEGSIVLKFKSAMTINPNWAITTQTTPMGYNWIKSPALKLGPIDIPIGFIADNFLKNNQKPIAKSIDNMVETQLNLRKYGLDAWKELSTPFKINEEYNTWVVIHPVDLLTIPITSSKGKIVHQMSIKALAEVFIGQPPHQVLEPLPDLKIVDRVDKDFSLLLQTKLLYTEMTTIARKHLIGNNYQIGERNISITNLDIYPHRNKLTLKADVEGDIKGTIYFTGRPVYDTTTAEIKLEDVDFDISTRNLLHKTAGWLLNGTINRRISQQLIFPIQKSVEEARSQINEYLNNNKLTPELTLNGKINRIGFGEIKILEEGLLIPVDLGGTLKVQLQAKFGTN